MSHHKERSPAPEARPSAVEPQRCKRVLDVAVSSAVLIVLAPLFVIIAVAVWIDSGRPVLFGQRRVGRGFRPFTIWKFRSMRSAAGPPITASGDERITHTGRILRRTKLDELPQFWNVFRGDMSLVGPRPELPQYVKMFSAKYERILRIRPGITDPATLAFRNEEAVLAGSLDPESVYIERVLPLKLRLSEEYVSTSSLRHDVLILWRTLLALMQR